MNDYLSVVMGSLSNLNPVELEKIIEAAQRKKEKIETDKRCSAAIDLVEAFIVYKEATGKHEVKLYDCIDGSTRTDVIVKIDQLFVDDNGDICHNVLF
jgi:hypothetical protein|uniref:Uncharacterized protein n=1 Tax=Siphoviridae sp. ctB3v5 TaxID=2826186 RepID=A0A8S5M8U1_9CAUD|nr:MAG TPA: hypothetical protein [Siphoviridae sp. ctB3v5]